MKKWWMGICVLVALEAPAQTRWTGAGGSGIWDDPLNWEHAILPSSADEVLLDNSLLNTGYEVRLPDRSVIVRKLQVLPAAGKRIELILPETNTVASPAGSILPRAFEITGNGYALVIGEGGAFVNASGAASGYSLRLGDSMEIRNGGKYVHRSRTGHAELVELLSRAPGTETGVFRFENPDAASVLSLSGRVYGQLELSAAYTDEKQVSYTAAGTNPVRIRGDFILEEGVSCALNFSDTFHINGRFIGRDARLNMASSGRSCVFKLGGDLLARNTRINASNPVGAYGELLLAGAALQLVEVNEWLGDSIRLCFDNEKGYYLRDSLRLKHWLLWRKGTMRGTAAALLWFGPAAHWTSDSLAASAYTETAILKNNWQGEYLRFPLGSGAVSHWLSIRGGAGDPQVTYRREDAALLGEQLGVGLDHLSRVEYWTLSGVSGSSLQLELSVSNHHSGGITDLSALRVALLRNGVWQDAGNAGTTGNAERGSINSVVINGWDPQEYPVSLASSVPAGNPLPVRISYQRMEKQRLGWDCVWQLEDPQEGQQARIMYSPDGYRYKAGPALSIHPDKRWYRQALPGEWEKGFCRIELTSRNGNLTMGTAMRFGATEIPDRIRVVKWSGNYINIYSRRREKIKLQVWDNKGALCSQSEAQLNTGYNQVPVNGSHLTTGVYSVLIQSEDGYHVASRLFLQ